MRLAVLVHAESVAPEVWAPLSRVLADVGDVVLAHAHADWTAAAMATWLPVLRRHRLELRHHFRTRETQDPAMIALALDAVDVAARVRLDGLVLVGDLHSSMPLLLRLKEEGLTVIVAGPPSTPLDIRDACTEFVDLGALAPDSPSGRSGRHRA